MVTSYDAETSYFETSTGFVVWAWPGPDDGTKCIYFFRQSEKNTISFHFICICLNAKAASLSSAGYNRSVLSRLKLSKFSFRCFDRVNYSWAERVRWKSWCEGDSVVHHKAEKDECRSSARHYKRSCWWKASPGCLKWGPQKSQLCRTVFVCEMDLQTIVIEMNKQTLISRKKLHF